MMGRLRRIPLGVLLLLLGAAAFTAPLLPGNLAPPFLGLVLIASGVLQLLRAYGLVAAADRRAGFLSAAMSIVAGLLLLALPQLVFAAMAILLGLTWVVDGTGSIAAALRKRDHPSRVWSLLDGAINTLLGIAIAFQWPLSGAWSLGIAIGLRDLSAGWSMLLGRREEGEPSETEEASLHPDPLLNLPPHEELGRLRAELDAETGSEERTHRYWCWMFVLTFFAIHVGRMRAEWNLVGLLSPAVAVLGDVALAFLLAYGIVAPLSSIWRFQTRPLERRAWKKYLAGVDRGADSGAVTRLRRSWLVRRMRSALRAKQARGSPTAALGWGLRVGLPISALLVAINPIWGVTWYFNTETWVTGAWELWAEHRTEDWREEMVHAVRAEYRESEGDLFRVEPEGVGDGSDFSFLVIGDPGEGDASQHILRDQYLFLGQRPEVKFLVVSSDVIYPQGAMMDYEPKFYLPFKGFEKPIYALPGNHDWYDALEAFAANFFEPSAARAAMRARRESDHKLTTTTEARIEDMIAEAARLREAYGIRAGLQRAPFFEVQTPRFALIVVDTGILRRVDEEQERWLRAALERSRGKLKMALLGHPLYARGQRQSDLEESFAKIHGILREHEVDVAMGGDTHDFEYYEERYRAPSGERSMHHFVNGGGGAYLSIGTALAWPEELPVENAAHYPRADQIIAKLDRETPRWKRPMWFWLKRFGAWPSSAESMASAFDYNRAPFFQSFMEVRVEPSLGQVRFLVYGANGRLRWRDLHCVGSVVPEGQGEDALVEFVIPLP